MFGRDLVNIDEAYDINKMSLMFSTQRNFYGLNETLTLPTIGGLTLQYGHKLSVDQQVQYFDGLRDSNYGAIVK